MKKLILSGILASIMLLGLNACKESDVGTAVGAAAGAGIGYAATDDGWGAAAGAGVGALLGKKIGESQE